MSTSDSCKLVSIANLCPLRDGAIVNEARGLYSILYDDAEHGYSFSLDTDTCQVRTELTNTTTRLTPRFETIIPAGRSGWLKLYTTDTTGGLLGATGH